MLAFETMNQMVYSRDPQPDNLSLPELVAWEGLQYVYALLGLGKRSRDECSAIKTQIGKEYDKYVAGLGEITRELSEALALYAIAKKSNSPEIKRLLSEIREKESLYREWEAGQ